MVVVSDAGVVVRADAIACAALGVAQDAVVGSRLDALAAARHLRQQASITRLGRRALEDADRESLFDEASRLVAETLGADYGGVFLYEGERLRLSAVHGLPAGAARDLELTRADAMPPTERLSRPDPIVTPDWERERFLRRPDFALRFGIRSSVAVPLAGRLVHGVIAVARRVPHTPPADEVRYVEAVAHVLAAALDRAAVESEGRHRALHDTLTGLPGRMLALDRVAHAQRRTVHGGGRVAVLAVDLDRFKEVNDLYGVAAGDEVVGAIATRLRELARPADTVARLSGDTFALVCEDVDDDGAAAFAERIVEEVRRPVRAAGRTLSLTASVGLAFAEAGDDPGDVLRDAEAAMDRAKGHGRDRVELFDARLRARVVERVRLQAALREAVERDELFVAYQPIMALSTGQVTATEALVRWRHPERGVVPPGEFIPVAEESGLIGKIGELVLRRACADVAARCARGHRLTCHVNLSPAQAADPGLADRVAAIVDDTGLPADALVLELTESSLMEAGEEPLRVLQAIRSLGVRIALDDFGTGHSSLARLRSFPVDGLKIDRSFVAALDDGDPSDALLVAGIVQMARALGLTVVAEGVETPAQVARLERMGCRYAQGFHLARPGELDALDRLLEPAG